ncbi:MAG: hypothetical protein N4J56_007094 [Chroococcidiopsis sp. SAG 2025]|nr:hypothetical protein [Chroococcidiopsis sp. SAG 2025]
MSVIKHSFCEGDIVIMHGTAVTVVRAWESRLYRRSRLLWANLLG